MRAFIYTGGDIFPDGIWDKPEKGDIIIAADSGMKNAARLGLVPDIVVGDFDSFPEVELPKTAERVTVPAEKDFTDTQLAIEVALEKKPAELIIVGGLSGRLDHTLSNLAILERLYDSGPRAILTDGNNRVRYIRDTSELIPRSHFCYFSLLATDKKVKGVTIEGAKYPLKNACLRRNHQFAVSNEIEKNCALVTVKKGGLYLIESRDLSSNSFWVLAYTGSSL